jgi:hypothetical protein
LLRQDRQRRDDDQQRADNLSLVHKPISVSEGSSLCQPRAGTPKRILCHRRGACPFRLPYSNETQKREKEYGTHLKNLWNSVSRTTEPDKYPQVTESATQENGTTKV